MPIILLSNDPQKLAEALAAHARTATVEAEYGDVTVQGSIATLAHHGKNAGNRCPCNYENTDFATLAIEAIGISHVDLDTLGGVAAILGHKYEAPSFWALAEKVDLQGAHKLGTFGASPADLERLYAYWAWNESHKVFPPRDGSALDVTAQVSLAIGIIKAILAGNGELREAGREFRDAEAALNASSLISEHESGARRVFLRSAEAFTNHLYVSPEGIVADAVVGYNAKFKSVTISFSDGQGDACAFVQSLWGPLAGGHKGIAGSPRGQELTRADAAEAASKLVILLGRVEP